MSKNKKHPTIIPIDDDDDDDDYDGHGGGGDVSGPPSRSETPLRKKAKQEPPPAPARSTITPPPTNDVMQQLLDMGFPPKSVDEALAACSGNAQEAVQWLLTGGKKMATTPASSSSFSSSSAPALVDLTNHRGASSASSSSLDLTTCARLQKMSPNQRKAEVIRLLTELGYDYETSVELARKGDSVERYLELMESGRWAATRSRGSSSGSGGLFALEDEALWSGSHDVVKHLLEDRRESDLNDPRDLNYRIVTSRLAVSLQDVSHIHSITYVINPALLERFRLKESEFKLTYGEGKPESSYVLAFHGTTPDKAEKIIQMNFRLDMLGDHTHNQGAFGAGIYFSEYARTSRAYGPTLLLCRLLPGRSYDITSNGYNTNTTGIPLTPGYDSHRAMKDQKGRGQELVIFDVDQILPCYLIRF